LFIGAAIFAFHVSIGQIQYWILTAILVLLIYPIFFRKPYAKHLLNCLHSRDSSLVLNSVQALNETPQVEAIEPLVGLLNESRSEEVKRSAIWALERIPDPEAMRKVQPYLSDSTEPLHAVAIEGLRHSPEFQAIYTLLGLLRRGGSGEEEVRSRTFQILKDRLGHEGILLFLSYLYDPNPEVQADALKALAGYKRRSLIPIFLPMLHHSHPRVRAGAAMALYPFKESRERTRSLALAAIAALKSSEQLEDRLAAYEAIGELRLSAEKPALVAAFKERAPNEILGAAMALAQIGDPIFVLPYLDILAGEDESLAVEAAKRLVKVPARSRKLVLDQVRQLPDAQAIKARSRLRKAPADFFRDLRVERESLLEAQIPL
jgi:HEAT repeat protein